MSATEPNQLHTNAAISTSAIQQASNVISFAAVAAKKPPIMIVDGELDRIFDASLEALKGTGEYFNRGGLVKLEKGAVSHPGKDLLRIELARIADFKKTVSGKTGTFEVPSNPPAGVAAAICSMENPPLPDLKAVVSQPFILPDGSLLTPGYSKEHKVFGHFNAAHFQLPEKPTADDARDSIAILRQAFSTFDFDNGGDWAACLCSIFCAIQRPILELAPLILITSPVAGTGKGKLARCISLFSSPKEPDATVLPEREEEIAKKVLSLLLKATPVLFFDEVNNAEIDSPTIRSIATSSTLSDRFLGFSRDATVSTSVLAILTANNAVPVADTARRTLQIRLDPRCENPSLRSFAGIDPVRNIQQNRTMLICCALILMRFYIQNSFKPSAKAIGSFTEWDAQCRMPSLHFTMMDPTLRMQESIMDDPKKIELSAVLQGWWKVFQGERVSSAEVVRRMTRPVIEMTDDERELKDALDCGVALKGQLNSRIIGKWLSRHKKRLAGGHMIIEAGLYCGSMTYRVVEKNEGDEVEI